MKKKIAKLKVRKLGILDDYQLQAVKGGSDDISPGAAKGSAVATCDDKNRKVNKPKQVEKKGLDGV